MTTGDRQLRLMAKRAKATLAGADTSIQWSEDVWNVSNWLPKRESSAGRHLHFTLSNIRRDGWVPLPPPFSEFAKASVVLLWSRSRVGLNPLRVVVHALRYLLQALERRNTVSPCELRPDDFFEALATFRRRGVKAVTQMGHSLELIAAQVDRFELTPQPIAFINPLTGRRRQSLDVDPQDLTRRIAEVKLPQLETLAAYAQCTNHPLNDDERILLRATDLHIALGTRIGEALTIPLDCWVEEEVKDLRGRALPDPQSGESQRRYGIRYYAEKGYDLAINWLGEQDVPLARRAVTELTALCAKARAVARWLEQHPGRLWEYAPDQLVSVAELIQHLRYASREALRKAMCLRGIHIAVRRRANDSAGDHYYRAGDIERAFVSSHSRLAAIREERGKVILRLSDALCVKFQGQFGFTEHVRNDRRPLLITAGDIQRALGGGSQGERSVFDRRGMMTKDAQGRPQRIRMNTHSTRHWKNALYDVGGMSDLQQTWAMGRKDVRQTRVYQHRTVQEQTEIMRRFQKLSYTERANHLRGAIREGRVGGPLADAYQMLSLNSPTEAALFLQTYASGIHVTPWGICANDFTLSPCRKYLQCYDRCRHYHRTADPEEQRRLEDLRTKMKVALEVMRMNAVGEAGADKWVNMMETKLANLEHALTVVPRISEHAPVQMFPDGVDRLGTVTAGKSVI